MCYLTSSRKKKNYVNVSLLVIILVQDIIYNYNHSFYNITIYYQIVNYLNTKNNINFILVFLLLYTLNKKKEDKELIYIYLLFLFFFRGCSSVEINQVYLYFISNKGNINNNLLNGIMLIHPYVLYFYYIVFIYYYSYNVIRFCLLKLFFLNFLEKQKYLIKTLFVVIYTSILLGCLWAEQELSWGG